MLKGQKMPEEVRRKKLCEGNVMWKGDNVGLDALHLWVRSRKTKPENCEKCQKAAPMDMANIGHTYRRNLEDWRWLCRRCHMEIDGRLDKLIARNKGKENAIRDNRKTTR